LEFKLCKKCGVKEGKKKTKANSWKSMRAEMEGTPTNVDAKKQVDELWEAIAQTANQHFKHSMPERILVRHPHCPLNSPPFIITYHWVGSRGKALHSIFANSLRFWSKLPQFS
jgi:hypothetical protein